MCEAKVATMMRPGAAAKRSAERRADVDLRARVARRGPTFVESEHSTSTPARRARRSADSRAARRRAGCGSSLKSPVWTMVPTGVSIARPMPSTIECVTRIGSTRKRPDLDRVARPHRRAGRRCSSRPCSRSLLARRAPGSAACRRRARRSSRSRYGSAPMWSSWPCVRTTARKRLAPAREVREVGDDVVDARQLVVREHEPAVDGDDVVAGLDRASC